jgi:hypothetical protein
MRCAAPVREATSTRSQGFAEGERGNLSSTMLRKALWTALYGVMGALSTLAARRFASRVWRIATGEEPPTKK